MESHIFSILANTEFPETYEFAKEMAKKYTDPDKIFEQAAERAIRETLKTITEENKWILISAPRIKIRNGKAGLSYEAELTLFPEAELGDYKKIAGRINKNTEDKIKKIEIKEEEVRKAVDWLLESRMKTDEIKKETENKSEAELTDKIAAGIGNFKSAADLKENIKEGLKMEKIIREADRGRIEILEEILKNSKIELPDMIVEKTAQNLKEELKQSLRGGGQDFESYIKKYYQDENKLTEKLREKADREVKRHIILNEIAKREKIEPKKEEVEGEISKILEKIPKNQRKEADLTQLYDLNYGQLKNEKVFRFLESIK